MVREEEDGQTRQRQQLIHATGWYFEEAHVRVQFLSRSKATGRSNVLPGTTGTYRHANPLIFQVKLNQFKLNTK